MVSKVPARAQRHGVSNEILADRTCSDIIDAAFAVHSALGVKHHPDTYRNALAVELRTRGHQCHKEATFSVVYKKEVVGSFSADLLVDHRVLVQVSADPTGFGFADSKTDTVRGIAAGDVNVGLAFNFGQADLFFARIL
jgi:GxxExxY protein